MWGYILHTLRSSGVRLGPTRRATSITLLDNSFLALVVLRILLYLVLHTSTHQKARILIELLDQLIQLIHGYGICYFSGSHELVLLG